MKTAGPYTPFIGQTLWMGVSHGKDSLPRRQSFAEDERCMQDRFRYGLADRFLWGTKCACGSTIHNWLKNNGPKYGWEQMPWQLWDLPTH